MVLTASHAAKLLIYNALKLYCCQLSYFGIIFCRLLQCNDCLTKLDISFNAINVAGAQALAEVTDTFILPDIVVNLPLSLVGSCGQRNIVIFKHSGKRCPAHR
jgi:hypothetical protein